MTRRPSYRGFDVEDVPHRPRFRRIALRARAQGSAQWALERALEPPTCDCDECEFVRAHQMAKLMKLHWWATRRGRD